MQTFKSFMILVVIILMGMVVALNVVKFQEDTQECDRGGHNVQCPAEVREWPPADPGSSTSTPSLLH